jgi:adenosylhomocysteine nucleosidase
MSSDIVVFAMRDEAPNLFKKYKNVYCIGVGKVNSAINITMMINEYKPKRVINLGTAGSIDLEPNVYRINKLIQHDVNLTAVGLAPGYHLNDTLNVIRLPGEGRTCASGDMFVTEAHKLRVHCDLVEMEAYSVAKACIINGIKCEIWKYISDKADENAGVTFNEQVAAGEELYIKVLQDLNVKLEEK